jgi:drug/metabolite transporter superfamily protein YnfA
MEQLIMGVVALTLAVAVRRKEAFAWRWQPTRHTWVAVGTGLLALALSASLLLFEAESVAARLIHYGGIYIVCGCVIPWGYTLLVERNTPAAMGVKRERWAVSLALNLILAGLLLPIILFEGDLSALQWGPFSKAVVVLAGAGGLFELFLYYGFIHLRLEKAFGTIPAILATSALYVSWHTGTQLPLEPDPLAAVVKLFGVGVMAQSVFSLTHNLLIIWPFFHGMGVMIDFAVNLGEVERVSAGFPWAVGTLVLMAVFGALLALLVRWHKGERKVRRLLNRGGHQQTGP